MLEEEEKLRVISNAIMKSEDEPEHGQNGSLFIIEPKTTLIDTSIEEKWDILNKREHEDDWEDAGEMTVLVDYSRLNELVSNQSKTQKNKVSMKDLSKLDFVINQELARDIFESASFDQNGDA